MQRRLTKSPPRPAGLLGTSNLLGCTGEAIAGTAREVEEEPALVAVAGPLARRLA